MYAHVIVDAGAPGLTQPFTYRIPEDLHDRVLRGTCVVVPFSGRELVGYVFDITDSAPDVEQVKDILAVVPEACALPSALLDLARWISDYYASSLAHTVRAMVPGVMSASMAHKVRLHDPQRVSRSSPNQQRLIEVLTALGGEAEVDALKARLNIDGFSATLRQLKSRGAIEVVYRLQLPRVRTLTVRGVRLSDEEAIEPDELESRAPKQAALLRELSRADSPLRQAELLRRTNSSSSPIRALVEKGLAEKVDITIRREPLKPHLPPRVAEVEPTPDQEEALRVIRGASRGVTLVHGVTGSGKTEVYLRAIADVLERGQSCIALVPEISLTTHLMTAYLSRFGDSIAILHSGLSAGERHDEWRRIESGEARIVLGARSAIFAPVRNLGLVVMDEEHEPSYKQDNAPRYHARSVAERRTSAEGASLILGSATPSIETFHRASTGEIALATLTRRIDDRPMPAVRSVDLREQFERGRRSFFSEELQAAVADRLARGEQVILFVNRRGYASFILCRTCGYTARCSNCDVSLTYHAGARQLRCHHCNSCQPAPTVCPQCGGPHIRQFGVGTERVEAETKTLFPEANVIRMDSDTTSRKGSLLRLLRAFEQGEAQILIGTQMVAKGFDFPNVTLVGVISADTALHMPDFRAAERTFQLLTQVSGRAGRGDVPGEVIVQSFSSDHYAVRTAALHDYTAFYEQEIEFRRELSYPPFSRLINVVSSDPVSGYAEGRLRDIARRMEGRIPEDVEMLGPAPAPMSKLKGLFRWHILLRDRRPRADQELQRVLEEVLAGMPSSARTGLTIDVEPSTML